MVLLLLVPILVLRFSLGFRDEEAGEAAAAEAAMEDRLRSSSSDAVRSIAAAASMVVGCISLSLSIHVLANQYKEIRFLWSIVNEE